jgi:hypothetical protein
MEPRPDSLKKDWTNACSMLIDACTSGDYSIRDDSIRHYKKDSSTGSYERTSEGRDNRASISIHGSKNYYIEASLQLWEINNNTDTQEPRFEYIFQDFLTEVNILLVKRLREYLRSCKTLAVQTDKIIHNSKIEGCYNDSCKQFLIFPPVQIEGDHFPDNSRFCHINVHQDERFSDRIMEKPMKGFLSKLTVRVDFCGPSIENMFYDMQRAFLGVVTKQWDEPRPIVLKNDWGTFKCSESFLKLKWHPIVAKPADLDFQRRLAVASSHHEKSKNSVMNNLSDDLIHKIVGIVENDEVWDINTNELLGVIIHWYEDFRSILSDYENFSVGFPMCCARCRLVIA